MITTGSESRERVPGLDTLRWVCAMWVVFAHIPPFPVNQWLSKDNGFELILRGILKNLFCGPAAVIVFFVISGFCIHFPQRQGRPLEVVPFLARRFLRIGIPFVVAVTAGYLWDIKGLQIRWESFLVGASHRKEAELGVSILWSLVAEMVYYAVYPVLLRLAGRISWGGVLGGACAVALGILASDPRARYFPHFGNTLTPWIGLPSWLLGVMLAERFSGFCDRPVSRRHIWCWRAGVFVVSSSLQAFFFHPPAAFLAIGYPWTLQFFAVLAMFWLEREIRWWRRNPPPPLLEWAGTWSYSIYLFHVAAPPFTGWILKLLGRPELPALALCILRNLLVFPVSYLFARCVEFPSWNLARRVAAHFKSAAVKPPRTAAS